MSLLELIVLLIIAGVAGAVAEFVVGFSPGGFLVAILIGLIGAYLGTWIAGQLHLQPILTININGQVFPLAWAIIGSLVLVMALSLLRGRGPRRFYRRSRPRRRYYR